MTRKIHTPKPMAQKTYALRPEDAEKLVSYACRYSRISTAIDEENNVMTVYTTWVHTDEPQSMADMFGLEILEDAPPKMPKDEYQRRVKGEFPERQG